MNSFNTLTNNLLVKKSHTTVWRLYSNRKIYPDWNNTNRTMSYGN